LGDNNSLAESVVYKNGLQKFRILPDKRKREGLETAATQLAEKTYLNCVTPKIIENSF